jgi:hypothetical protein
MDDDVPRLVVARIPEFDPTELALIVSALKGDVVPVSVLALTLLDLLHGAARIHFDRRVPKSDASSRSTFGEPHYHW